MADAVPAVVQKTGPGHSVLVIVQKPYTIDRDRVFVNPPTTHIGSGESQLKVIGFRNDTGKLIRLWLPNAHHYLEAKPEELTLPFEIKDGNVKEFKVKASPEPGHYPYHIYCEAIQNGAEGHSEPHVGCP